MSWSFYDAETARIYEEVRENDRWWQWEASKLREILTGISESLSVVDAPIGTGRFLDLYSTLDNIKRIVGLDGSVDMLKVAQGRLDSIQMNKEVVLSQADLISLTNSGALAEVGVCFRLLHLINPDSVEELLESIGTISNRYIILQAFSLRDSSFSNSINRIRTANNLETTKKVDIFHFAMRSVRGIVLSELSRSRRAANRKTKSSHKKVAVPRGHTTEVFSHRRSTVVRILQNKGWHLIDSQEHIDLHYVRSQSPSIVTGILIFAKESS
jgi:hypothetical protein